MQLRDTSIVPDNRLQALRQAVSQVNGLILGKAEAVEMAFIALLAKGHLLIEDRPGLGKTTMARSMAATLGIQFQRMQFTADLLPSDIIGVSIYEPDKAAFRFHPGPIFTELLLADEINRAPPRTQSALLEAMAEYQVTVDGTSHKLPEPFFVIATQNPVDLSGTFPLPDSQMDRFLLRISLGYPDAQSEKAMLAGQDRKQMIEQTRHCLSAADVLHLQDISANVHASDHLVAYIQSLVHATRNHSGIRVGLSPRAGLALLHCSRARALIQGRDHVLPTDVQALFCAVAAHRIVANSDSSNAESLARQILTEVAVD